MKPTLIFSLLALALGGTYAASASGFRLAEGLAATEMSKAELPTANLLRVDGGRHSQSDDDDDDHYDDHGRHCGDDDSYEDGDGACNAAANPAPAGTITPPSNGLFGDGKAPIVKSN